MVTFIEELEHWKNTALSNFCLTKCKNTCCNEENLGLLLFKDELERVIGKKLEEMDTFERVFKYKIIPTKIKDFYYFGQNDFCPRYDKKTKKCTIYKDRPQCCRTYPIYKVDEEVVVLNKGCELTEEDPEFKELVKIAKKYGKSVVKKE